VLAFALLNKIYFAIVNATHLPKKYRHILR
jgi:hypothetical protein